MRDKQIKMKMSIGRYVFHHTGYLKHIIVNFDKFTDGFFITKIFIGNIFCKYDCVWFHQSCFRITLNKRQGEYTEEIGIHDCQLAFFKRLLVIDYFCLAVGV